MRRLLLAGMLLAASCSPAEPLLVVQLTSDLTPGLEVTTARTVVAAGPSLEPAIFEEVTDLSGHETLVEAIRIAEGSVSRGRRFAKVTLLDPTGMEVASRTIAVQLDRDLAITAVITRSCGGVECPGEGGPEATTCLGGRCVSPECTPETPELCPAPQCTASEQCAAGAVDCVRPACLAGSCGQRADDGRCPPELPRCDPRRGCVSVAFDAGPGGIGAGRLDGAVLDAGAPDAGAPDAGAPDAGAPDAGALDAGALDAGAPDAGAPDAATSDASVASDAGPAVECSAACPGECQDGVCTLFDPDMAVCPEGVPCHVTCLSSGCRGGVFCSSAPCEVVCRIEGCRGGVDCGSSGSCQVECRDLNVCPAVRCGPGDCAVQCNGEDTCGQVDCLEAGRCDVQCVGPGSCADVRCGGDCSVTCGPGTCGSIDCSRACACDVTCEGGCSVCS